MNLFKKKLELDEKEKQFESVINSLLGQKETKKQIKLTTTETTCLLVNDEKHFKVKVDSQGIIIQNTTFATKERLRDKVIDHFKNLIINNMNEETDETLKEMDLKEQNLIENINSLLVSQTEL